jgi:archaellum biogenesis ATPase FlaH
LPNKGEHYETKSNRTGPYFDPLEAFSDAIAAKQDVIKAKELAIAESIHNSQMRRSERLAQGFKSPIDAFNASYIVQEVLLQAGYDQRGDLYRHPYSESGSFSASVKGQRVHSLSSADPLYTEGGGVGAHDAFSAFTVLCHNGDTNSAIKDACNYWLNGWNEEKAMNGNLEGFEIMPAPASTDQGQTVIEMSPPRYDLRPPVIKIPFKLTSIGELLKQPPTLKWLIKGYLPPEGLGFINGDPATGKSLLALDWFCHIACGIPWRGNPVKQGGVVIIAGEGHFGLRRRLKAWDIHNNIDLSDKPIVVSDVGASLTDKQSVEAVTEAIEGFVEEHGQLSLIIIDTLHRNLGAADENSSEDMAVYFNNLDALRAKYECLIMTVHHSGHGDKSRARGSSSIRAAIDIEYQISKSNDVSEVSCQKMKDAAKPKKFAFEPKEIDLPWLHDTGENETSVVIVEAETSSGQGKKLSPQHQVVFEALCRLTAEANVELNADPIKIANDAWRDQSFIKMTHDNDDSKRKAFKRAKDALIEFGYVDVENDEYWIEVLSLSPQAVGVFNKISGELSSNAIMGVGQTGH